VEGDLRKQRGFSPLKDADPRVRGREMSFCFFVFLLQLSEDERITKGGVGFPFVFIFIFSKLTIFLLN
jgi:hypothetical protein